MSSIVEIKKSNDRITSTCNKQLKDLDIGDWFMLPNGSNVYILLENSKAQISSLECFNISHKLNLLIPREQMVINLMVKIYIR